TLSATRLLDDVNDLACFRLYEQCAAVDHHIAILHLKVWSLKLAELDSLGKRSSHLDGDVCWNLYRSRLLRDNIFTDNGFLFRRNDNRRLCRRHAGHNHERGG